MTDYYEKKIITMDLIEKLAATGVLSEEDISFQVLKSTAMSKRFTMDYIKENLSRSFFIKDKNGIIKTTKRPNSKHKSNEGNNEDYKGND